MIRKEWIKNIKDKKDYKGFVGVAECSDIIGATQFNILTDLGMRDYHTLLDIGAGCLRGGKISIIYLNKGNYYAIEPEKWLIDEAIIHDIGAGLIEIKKPNIVNNKDFKLSIFNKQFDYIMADSIFIHASKKQIMDCILELKKVMHKKSVFIFNFIPGQDNKNNEWTYPSHVSYTNKFILDAFKGFKLSVIKKKYPGKQVWIKATI